MSTQKSALANPIINYVMGPIFMVGGMWLSTSKPSFLSFQDKLAEQGIPLDLGKTVAIIGVFLILFPLINYFFVKPLEEALGNRAHELESTFGEAESLRKQMNDLKSDYEQRLAQTEAEARAQIQAQFKEAEDTKKRMIAEAAAKADDMQKAAAASIESEKKQILGQLRVHVATLSLQATEKILKENVDTDKNRKIIDDFLASVEVKN